MFTTVSWEPSTVTGWEKVSLKEQRERGNWPLHSSSHSSKVIFPILCLMSEEEKKKRLGTLGETFQLCKSAQSLPRKKVVTINIQPLALTLSIKEDSHRTEERDASKLYTKWPGKWATNIVTVGHSQVSLFSPSTSPCLELKQMKAEFPVTLLFPHMWTSWEHILPKTVLGERHFPKSHMAF